MPLSTFTPLATQLFDLCAAAPWPQLERSSLLIDFEQRGVELVDQDRTIPFTSLALVIELAPLVAELRQHLLAGEPDPQRDLAFPPMLAGMRQ